MDIKKFNNFDGKGEDPKDDQEKDVFKSFVQNHRSSINESNKAEEFLKLFEGVLGEVNGQVEKDNISKVLVAELVALNEKFISFKDDYNKHTTKINEVVKERVDPVISRTNNVIKKYDEEISKFKTLHYNSSETYEQQHNKFQNDSEKLKEAVTSILVDFETQLNQLDATSENIEQKNKQYNKQLIETNDKLQNKIIEFQDNNKKIIDTVDRFEKQLTKLDNTHNTLNEKNKLFDKKLIDTNTKIEEKVSEVKDSNDKISSTVSSLEKNIIENVNSVENSITKLVATNIKEAKSEIALKIKNLSIETNNSETTFKKIIKEQLSDVKKDIKSTDSTLIKQSTRFKLFEDKTKVIIKETKDIIENVKQEIKEQNIIKDLKENKFAELDKKISFVEKDVKNIFKDNKFEKLSQKILFVEKTLKQFNEKSLLTEDIIPLPARKTSDPLTPLDQNFVTADQLKQHYKLFINRIQKQMMSIGGGGAVRIDQLDDVNIRNSSGVVSIANGQSLVYITDGGVNKFEPRTVTGGGGSGGNVSSVGFAVNDISNAQILQFVTTAVTANKGNLSLSGNIIPDADNVHSLGTAALRFKDLFLSGNTFSLGGLTLKDTGGGLKVETTGGDTVLDATPSAPGLSSADFTIANIIQSSNTTTSFGANIDARLTGANVGSVLTGGTDIEIAADGTFNFTGSGGFTNAKVNAALVANLQIGTFKLNSVQVSNGVLSNSNIGAIVVSSGALKTANIVETSTDKDKLFFSNARVNAAFIANVTIGTFKLNSVQVANGVLSNSNIGAIVVSSGALKTNNVVEATNLYFTEGRARGSLSKAAGSGAYNDSTGVITIPATTAHIAEVTDQYFSNIRGIEAANSTSATTLVVTNNGSAAYKIDQYGTGNNPEIFVTAGQTVTFYLNGISGHPFHIRDSSGGSSYNVGLSHIALDGTRTTGSNAQGKVAGYVTFKVPYSLAGTSKYYQCSNHSAMGNKINIGHPTADLQLANISGVTTANVAELTNLYFSNTRANGTILANVTTMVEAPTHPSTDVGTRRVFFSNARSNATILANLVTSVEATTAGVTDPALRRVFFSNARSNATILANLITSVEATTAGVTDPGARRVFYSNARANAAMLANVTHSLEQHLVLAVSDEATDLTTGAAKVTFHAPVAMTLTRVPRITVQTAAVGSDLLTVDINDDGATILSTKLTIDATEKTSRTAAAAGVLSATVIEDDSILTVDIDTIGNSTAGKGLKLILYYRTTEA